MAILVLVCLLIAAVCAGTLGMVIVGMAGHGADRMPRFAARSRRVARHLDGVAAAPESFASFATDPRASVRRTARRVERDARTTWTVVRPRLQALRAQAEPRLRRAQQQARPALRTVGETTRENVRDLTSRLVSH